MSRRQAYLCRKVQPGEIKPMDADAMRTLSQADDLVAYGIRRGLLSYPVGTQFDQDGRPIPKLFAPERSYSKPIEAYPCLRAYLMHDNGSTHVQVAKAIKASTAKIGDIIAHGREIYRRQAVELAREGQETVSQSKRAGRPAKAQGGASKTSHFPPGWEPSGRKPVTQGPKRTVEPVSVNSHKIGKP